MYGNDLVLTAGGGTHNIGLTIPVRNMFNITGSATLAGNWVIQLDAGVTPLKYMTVILNWRASIVLATSSVTVFGRALTKEEAMRKSTIICYYNGSSWEVTILVDSSSKAYNSGTTTTTVTASGGTLAIDPALSSGVQIITGSATLASGFTVTSAGTPVDGDSIKVQYRATLTYSGGNVVTIYGLQLSSAQALKGASDIYAIYDGGTASWRAILLDSTLLNENLWESGSGLNSCQRLNADTGCVASGDGSHAEGYETTASGDNSHSEGDGGTASGLNSHVEGNNSIASGASAHAEGYETTASGDGSHAEGYKTTASGANSHAEGDQTSAIGDSSHAEGESCAAKGAGSSASGNSSVAIYPYSKVFSSSKFSILGDNQNTMIMLQRATTNATPVNLIQDITGAAGLAIPTDCTVNISIRMSALQISGSAGTPGDNFAQDIYLSVKNLAGTLTVTPTTAVTVANVHTVASDVLYKIPFKDTAFGGTVSVGVSGTDLQITVTGEVNKTIQWNAYVSMVWIGYNNFSI